MENIKTILQELNNSPDLNKENVMAKMVSVLNANNPHLKLSDVNGQFTLQIINRSALTSEEAMFEKCTLLHIVAATNCKRMVELLIEIGAEVNQRDLFLHTPLHYVAKYGNIEAAEILIKKGANVNSQDKDGKTPLHYAAMYGHTEVAKLLIEKGADIDAQDCFEREPLYYALKYNNLRTAKFLLDNDADRSDLYTYITKTSKWKCVLSASIASITAIVVTSSVLFYTTNLPMFSIIGATISSTLMFGTIIALLIIVKTR